MKKVILGGMMMLAGLISTAILMSGTMATGYRYTMLYSFSRVLRSYQLTTPFAIFITIAVIGLALSLWGLFEKQDE